MNVFWHRPTDCEIKARWHAYNTRGESLCGKYVAVGVGKPDDARDKMPRQHRCGECLRKMLGK